jgi:hypothetical protein
MKDSFLEEKVSTGIFFSHQSARCPCAFRAMPIIDINHAYLVQGGLAKSYRRVYNKSPRRAVKHNDEKNQFMKTNNVHC